MTYIFNSWSKKWRLTSSIVYQPVRLRLSLQEVRESLVAALPEVPSALTSMLWRKLKAVTGTGSIWQPLYCRHVALDSASQNNNVK